MIEVNKWHNYNIWNITVQYSKDKSISGIHFPHYVSGSFILFSIKIPFQFSFSRHLSRSSFEAFNHETVNLSTFSHRIFLFSASVKEIIVNRWLYHINHNVLGISVRLDTYFEVGNIRMPVKFCKISSHYNTNFERNRSRYWFNWGLQ
jgi:hypothetical protein